MDIRKDSKMPKRWPGWNCRTVIDCRPKLMCVSRALRYKRIRDRYPSLSRSRQRTGSRDIWRSFQQSCHWRSSLSQTKTRTEHHVHHSINIVCVWEPSNLTSALVITKKRRNRIECLKVLSSYINSGLLQLVFKCYRENKRDRSYLSCREYSIGSQEESLLGIDR